MKTNVDFETLMREFKSGRKSAMVEIFRNLRNQLFGYLFRLCQVSELAEDLLQETFIAIFRHADTFNPDRDFLPWAYTIARNKFLEWNRENKKIIPFSRLASKPIGHAPLESDLADSRMDIRSGLSRLSEPMREAFILKHFQGLTFKEVAEIQSVPLTTAKSRVITAAAKIRKIWEQNNE